MKKTLSLLAVISLALSASPGKASEITVRPYFEYMQSPTLGTTIAQGATLINSQTGNIVVFDINEDPPVNPPFDIEKGHIHWDFNLANQYNEPTALDDIVVTEDDTLVIDFNYMRLAGPTEAEYVVIMFRAMNETGDNFAQWYEQNSAGITGRFTNGDYDAYVIDDVCDMADPATTYGGLVFFNRNVQDAVQQAEVNPAIPEPATATLSLLALVGLAARRRRK